MVKGERGARGAEERGRLLQRAARRRLDGGVLVAVLREDELREQQDRRWSCRGAPPSVQIPFE